MPEVNRVRNYDMKVAPLSTANYYPNFGWVRSSEPVPPYMHVKSKEPTVLLKRRFEYGSNPVINDCEQRFDSLIYDTTRRKPFLGFLAFILMIAFLFVSGVELYYGITRGLELKKANTVVEETEEEEEEEPSNASYRYSTAYAANDDEEEEEEETTEKAKSSGGFMDTIKGVLDKMHDGVLVKVTALFDGEKNEDGEYTGVSASLAKSFGTPAGYFVSGDTIVGIIALILGIIFLIIFARICGIKGREKKRIQKAEEIAEQARMEVENMKRTDLSLMGRAQRKQFMWEMIITNAIRNANEDDDDDDDF